MKELFVEFEIRLEASPTRIWSALTNPEDIRQYMFGTRVRSEWKKGSPIVFEGEWEGKSYSDRGTILQFETNETLQYTYLSSFSGLTDEPGNYGLITCRLIPQDQGTVLRIRQENYPNEEARNHSQNGWKAVMEIFKNLVESTH